MSELRRVESDVSGEAADRDSRAEALLVEGLDQYFSGRYEDAIHVWTRVLFLDRSHARARAYIDRARTALGERQRRGDEMLQVAEDLVTNGELDRARSLLTQASRVAGDDERVARVWTDIERVERSRAGQAIASSRSALADPSPRRSWPATMGAVPKLLTAAAVGAFGVTLATSPVVREWIWGAPGREASTSMSRTAPTAVLSRSEIALVRARTLYARGRLAEALHVLDEASSSTSDRAEMDALRVEIQEVLLSTVPTSPDSPPLRAGAGLP